MSNGLAREPLIRRFLHRKLSTVLTLLHTLGVHFTIFTQLPLSRAQHGTVWNENRMLATSTAMSHTAVSLLHPAAQAPALVPPTLSGTDVSESNTSRATSGSTRPAANSTSSACGQEQGCTVVK